MAKKKTSARKKAAKRTAAQKRVALQLRKLAREARTLQTTISRAHKALARKQARMSALQAKLGLARANPTKRKAGTTVDEQLIETIRQEAAAHKGMGGLALVWDVRKRAKMERSEFDRALTHLMRNGWVVMHHHDHPSSLEADKRQGCLWVGSTCYHAVGLPKDGRRG